MTTFDRFTTPAHQGPKDYDMLGLPKSQLEAFQQGWSGNVNGWTNSALTGDPWSSLNDAPRTGYFNPLTDGGLGTGGDAVVSWVPFPNRLIAFLTQAGIVEGGQLSAPLSLNEVYALADTGSFTQGGNRFFLNPVQHGQDELQIPAERCPQVNWSGKYVPFSPNGPRGWQDEYCEWSIERNQAGKMQAINFTCENPAYYLTMWRQNPEAVLGLYQRYADPAVRMEDLFLCYSVDQPTGQKGEPVVDPTTGFPAYDPTNKWNNGPVRVPGSWGGAMHLTSPPNTLSAEIYLAAAATIPRSDTASQNPQTLICCAKYGQNFRNSDPNIGFNANAAAYKGMITLTDPVGLYIQQPQDFSTWKGPNGEDLTEFWQILRGTAGTGPSGSDQILHAQFAIPADAGFTIEDCTINGQPISSVAIILNQMKIALSVSLRPPPGPSAPVPCVTDRTTGVQPWPVQLLPESLFYGQSPSDLPALLHPGKENRFVLIVQGADKSTTAQNARIQFSDPNITATVETFLKDAAAVPGQTDGGTTQGYIMTVSTGSGAQPGPVQIRALNPGEGPDPSPEDHPWEYGLAMVPQS
ncbi:hypothetical protein [Phaeobacter sp. B1627]|uniref:hypothetical protein n=1 Tax=Phaeobacter sp. B1627 TaxID=2583809 RepID=UPI0011194874|nr:hypothetical protein [Phaeobacter sp. B1627]TNJ48067.1 hypothetical protein FGE21_02030 [Phaeobacter sp. B1627]